MKTKSSIKLLIALGIILLALLISNANIANATEVNANSLNNIPDTIEVGIPTTEAIEDGYMSKKMSDTLYTKVTESIGKNIPNSQVAIGFVSDKLIEISKVYVRLYDSSLQTTLIAEKTVTVKFNDNWNEKDSNYVKNKCINVSLNLNNSLKVDFSDNRAVAKVIEDAFIGEINDSSIKCTFYKQVGVWSYPEFYTQGILAFSKDNVIYYTVSTDGIFGTATMTIPESIEDSEEAFMNYALSQLKSLKKYNGIDLKMEKEEGKNEYLLYAGSYDPTLILLIKDTSNKKVVSTDKDTNVKLETTGAVVPTNTIMDVTPIKDGETFKTVEKVMSNVKNFKIFDITLESNGVKIQPKGNVKISIPIPSDMTTENLIVYRVDESGEKTEYKVTVETVSNVKYATFITNHFSTYVLAELSAQDNITTNNNQNTNTHKLDDSPKTGMVDLVSIISLIAIVSFAGIVILKRK